MSFRIGLSAPLAGEHWDGPTGLIHDIALAEYLTDHPDLGQVEFYLCGPPAMLRATRDMLAQLGVDEDHIAFDDFGI